MIVYNIMGIIDNSSFYMKIYIYPSFTLKKCLVLKFTVRAMRLLSAMKLIIIPFIKSMWKFIMLIVHNA